MNATLKSGAMIAMAAAAMALSGSVSAAGTPMAAEKVHCAGINSCKGTSECATAENSCKGMNSCKGHGFLSTTAAECSAKGGKVIESK